MASTNSCNFASLLQMDVLEAETNSFECQFEDEEFKLMGSADDFDNLQCNSGKWQRLVFKVM